MALSSELRAVTLTLVAFGVVLRVLLALVYEPISHADTHGYVRVAQAFLDRDLENYTGGRTPGYPLLWVAAGMNSVTVWLYQAALGILTSVVLACLAYKCTGSERLALVVGLFHSLSLNQLFFEANLLNETLATALVTLSVWFFVRAIESERQLLVSVLLGVCVALAVLTRPQYVILWAVYVFLLFIYGGERRARATLVLVLVASTPIIGWAAFNKATVGQFSMSTLTGFSLTNHSGGFFELVDDEHATLRDIYLKYRRNREEQGKSHTMTIWEARREMADATGLSQVELSRVLTSVSAELFVRHPGLYAKSVAKAWLSFWTVPNYWHLGTISKPTLSRALSAIWPAEMWLIRLMNLCFLAISGVVAFNALRRMNPFGYDVVTLLAMSSVVLASSLLQALIEYGENGRYSIGTQPLMATVVLIVFHGALMKRRSSTQRTSVSEPNA